MQPTLLKWILYVVRSRSVLTSAIRVRSIAVALAVLASCGGETLPAADPVTVHQAKDLKSALSAAVAGTEILLLPGNYEGGLSAANLNGSASEPIRIRGALTQDPPILRGGIGLHLSSVSHVVLENLIIESPVGDGLVIDSGNGDAAPSHHVTIQAVTIRNRSSMDGHDGIKILAVDDFQLVDCRIDGWTRNGQGIDIIGCRRGTISRCHLDGQDVGVMGLQIRGGSREIRVEYCDFRRISDRCAQIGGLTDPATFRRPLSGYEAQDVVIRDSHFCGGEAAVTFVNAEGGVVDGNVMYRQRKYVVRILQENLAQGFWPCRNGELRENIVVWRNGDLAVAAGVGPNTDPSSFRFSRNYWYCEDAPHLSYLSGFPSPESDDVHGQDPKLHEPQQCDLRPLRTRESLRQSAQAHPSWLLWLPAIGKIAMWPLAAIVAIGLVMGLRRIIASPDSLPKADDVVIPLRHWHAMLAIGLSLLFIYGSLLPLEYQPLELNIAWQQFHNIPYLKLDVYHLADWMANLLLFVPIAFCATAAVVAGRHHFLAAVAGAFAVWVGCVTLSVAIEFVQLWFPPRTVSQNDILAECIGAGVGCLVGLMAADAVTRWAQRALASVGRLQLLDAGLQLYAIGFLLYAVMPLDVVFDSDMLRLKWETGRIRIIGSTGPWLSPAPWLEFAGRLALSLPLGIYVGRKCTTVIGAAAICVTLGLLLESAQVFVFSRFASLSDAAMAVAGMLLGVWVTGSISLNFEEWWSTRAARSRRTSVEIATAIYVVFLIMLLVPPWKLERGLPGFERMNGFWTPPFAALYWGSEFHALTMTMEAILLFFPLGFAVCDLVASVPSGRKAKIAAWFAAVGILAAGLELGQAWIPDAIVDDTNTLCYVIGGVAGLFVRQLMSRSALPTDPERNQPIPLNLDIGTVAATTVLAAVMTGWAIPEIGGRAAAFVRPSGGDDGLAPPPQHSSVVGNNEVFTPAASASRAPLRVSRVRLPEIAEGSAIWGSIGRDRTGSIWVGLSVSHGEPTSARLLRLDPRQARVQEVANVVPQLIRNGIDVRGQSQSKIHSRIVQAADGWLYFTSMDEAGEADDGSKLPTWGSHLWRTRPGNVHLEHLAAVPEGLIAVAAGGQWVYALGLFDHVVYQFDTSSQELRSTRVGSVGGHVSRNLLADERGHVYVPRLEYQGDPKAIPNGQPTGQTSGVSVSLVELDSNLEVRREWPLEHYFFGTRWTCHGITGVCRLQNGSLMFVTSAGYLYCIDVSRGSGNTQLKPIGWAHPDGAAYTASLFCVDGERQLLSISKLPQRYDWSLFDLSVHTATAHALELPDDVTAEHAMLYGSWTRDDLGAFYIVGTEFNHPVLLRAEFTSAVSHR